MSPVSLRRTSLDWATSAMCEAADRVPRVAGEDARQAFGAIGETLWWIGVVDETLRERDQAAHEQHLEAALGDRPLLKALRYARNRFTHRVDIPLYVEAKGEFGADPRGYVTAWTWLSLPEERWQDLRRPKQAREGYRAYEATLAGADVHRSLVDALTPLRASAWEQLDRKVANSGPSPVDSTGVAGTEWRARIHPGNNE